MSEENHAHSSASVGEKTYWLDQPENVNLLIRLLLAAAVGVALADLFYHKHGHFGFQEWFAFDAVFGFVSYVGLVNAAKLFRKLVMRDEDYYEEASTEDALAREETSND